VARPSSVEPKHSKEEEVNEGQWTTSLLYGGRPHVWQSDVTTGDLRHDWFG
jgi:hypothetical protein